MRLFPRRGIIFPVSIIIGIQLVVLAGSLVITGDLFDPIVKVDSGTHRISQHESVGDDFSSLQTGTLPEKSVLSAKALFPIAEVLNSETDSDFLYQFNPETLPEREIEYIVNRGDTVSSLWARNGAPLFGATKALEAVRSAGLPRFSLRKGESVYLMLSSDGDIARLSKKLSDGATLILSGSSTEGYEASVIKPNIIEEERSVAGSITSSFAASASGLGVSYALIDDVVDLFSNRIEFNKAIQPGDSFTITFSEKRCVETGQVLDIGPILSASFKRGDKLFAAIRHKNSSGSFVYYDEKGQQGGDFFLRYPLKFSRISSTFSWARFHPILQRSRPHLGVDFAAPIGTPIRAVGDGLIQDIGFKSSPGNTIRIKHSDHWTTVYMHLQKFAPGLRGGQRVARGQVIGYVGTTGLSTGAHLHFELWENGRYVDPMAADLPSISIGEKGLPAGYLTATLKDLEQKHQKVQLAFVAGERNRG